MLQFATTCFGSAGLKVNLKRLMGGKCHCRCRRLWMTLRKNFKLLWCPSNRSMMYRKPFSKLKQLFLKKLLQSQEYWSQVNLKMRRKRLLEKSWLNTTKKFLNVFTYLPIRIARLSVLWQAVECQCKVLLVCQFWLALKSKNILALTMTLFCRDKRSSHPLCWKRPRDRKLKTSVQWTLNLLCLIKDTKYLNPPLSSALCFLQKEVKIQNKPSLMLLQTKTRSGRNVIG